MNALRLTFAAAALATLGGCATAGPSPTPSGLLAMTTTVPCPARHAVAAQGNDGDVGAEAYAGAVVRNGEEVARGVLQGHTTTLLDAGGSYRVDLLVLVGADGTVQDLQVQLPSGNGIVDRSAERAGWNLVFTPAIAGGAPTASCVTVPLMLGNQGRHARR
jgi:hypothetical protein